VIQSLRRASTVVPSTRAAVANPSLPILLGVTLGDRGSPHPCATHGVARPGEMRVSTALGCRSLIRMRALVQVQPGPQSFPDQRKRWSRRFGAGPIGTDPVWAEVLRSLPLPRPNNASEQPHCGSTVVGMPQIIGCTTVSEPIPVERHSRPERSNPAISHLAPKSTIARTAHVG
jgi:hypothetical protein